MPTKPSALFRFKLLNVRQSLIPQTVFFLDDMSKSIEMFFFSAGDFFTNFGQT